MQTIQCRRCIQIKSVSQFHKEPRMKSGFRAVCKECRKLDKVSSVKPKRGQPRLSLEKRFWEKVVKTEGCWIWTGWLKNGYGYIGLGGEKCKQIGVHRFSYKLHYGFLPQTMEICHKCDNPSCVRPDHLFFGTSASNTEDMLQKGREARGEKNGQSKLAANQVREIRNLYRERGKNQQQLADQFGVNRSAIYKIVNYLRWKHL